MLISECSVRLRKIQHISHNWDARSLSSSLADVIKSCLGVGPVAAHTGNLVAREVTGNRRPCGEAAPVIFAFANPPFWRLTLRDSSKILWLDPSYGKQHGCLGRSKVYRIPFVVFWRICEICVWNEELGDPFSLLS